MVNNNFERGLSNGYEYKESPTPEAINRVLVEMGEPGAYGPGHTVEWVRAIGVAMPERATLIEIGMANRHGE